jgi:hypothetical protein
MGKLVTRGVDDLEAARPDLAAEWHPTKNGDLAPGDVHRGARKKAWWLCGQGHEWEETVSHRNSGRRCPYCFGRLVTVGETDLATQNSGLAAEWHPTNNGDLTPRSVKSNAEKKVWWLCAQGHEWQAAVGSRHKGSGCPYCSGYFAILGETDLATTNPSLAAEWHPSKNLEITPREVSKSSHKKVWWLCSLEHSWQAAVSDRSSGKGCPVCSSRIVQIGFNDLATTNPGLAAAWHPSKNGEITPRDVMSGTNKKAWWICDQGHEWEAVILNRHAGSGCPYCSGRFAIRGATDLATVNPSLALEWHPTKNGQLTAQQVSSRSNKRVWWACSLEHAWQAAVSDRSSGKGCPVCSSRIVQIGFNDLGTTNPELAAEWHPTNNGDLSPQNVVGGSSKKAWWLCGEGHEWQAGVVSRGSGIGCPICAGQRVLVGFNDLATTNPGLAAEWHPSKNLDITPRDVMSGTNKKAWWLCDQGHEWKTLINGRQRGSGCPYCSGRFAIRGETDLATVNPSLALEWHPTKNGGSTPRDVTAGSGKKAWWRCPEGHNWSAVVASRSAGVGCPRCAKSGYDQTSPGYLYLLRKEHLDLQQFGITNHPENRLATHGRSGWDLLDVMGPADGVWILETETALSRFLRAKGFLLPRDYPDKFDGFTESWQSDELSFSTCAEMLDALRVWEEKA